MEFDYRKLGYEESHREPWRKDFPSVIDFREYIIGFNQGRTERHIPRLSMDDYKAHLGLEIVPANHEEVRTVSSTGGQKGVKPERYDLIPIEALDIMARLYGFGAQKYAAHNWRKGYEWSKSFASLMRHATRFWAGEDIDEETGLPHLAGAAFHCFTLMVFMQEQPDFDDRYKKVVLDVAEKIDIEIPQANYTTDALRTHVEHDIKEGDTYATVTTSSEFDPPLLFAAHKGETPTDQSAWLDYIKSDRFEELFGDDDAWSKLPMGIRRRIQAVFQDGYRANSSTDA